jgi:hypothetical protein
MGDPNQHNHSACRSSSPARRRRAQGGRASQGTERHALANVMLSVLHALGLSDLGAIRRQRRGVRAERGRVMVAAGHEQPAFLIVLVMVAIVVGSPGVHTPGGVTDPAVDT